MSICATTRQRALNLVVPILPACLRWALSMEMLAGIGIENIQERVLELNQYLTDRLTASGWKVLSPLAEKNGARSAETLVAGRSGAEW